MSLFLVLDPGETTGYALFDSAGVFVMKEQIIGIVEAGNFLEEMVTAGVGTVLYESFKVFPNKHLGGSDVPAAQVIGIIKWICEKHSIPYYEIDPKYKRIGYAWSQTKAPHSHALSHGPDARALGEYWLRKNKIKGMDDA